MLRTYRAVLRGNVVEWVDTPPPPVQPVPVHITLLEEEPAAVPTERGREMAGALEALAQAGGLAAISDPAAWEREIRHDRTLPDRED